MKVETILGKGIATPLQRQGGDFVTVEGIKAVESALRQLLLTRKGELRWEPDFGLNMDPLRHSNMTDELMAEVQVDVATSILKFEPRIEIVDLEVRRFDGVSTAMLITLAWRPISRGNRRNTVLTEVQQTEVKI